MGSGAGRSADPYVVLGVVADADHATIRRAYLDLARQNHPDLQVGDDRSRSAAERRMQQINLAWSVVGDPRQRAAHDARVGTTRGAAGTGAVRIRADAGAPGTPFRPFHEFDEDDDDSWRYEPDEGNPATAPGRVLTFLPPALFAVGVLVLAAAAVVGLTEMVAFGLVCVALSVVAFVAVPFITLTRGARHE